MKKTDGSLWKCVSWRLAWKIFSSRWSQRRRHEYQECQPYPQSGAEILFQLVYGLYRDHHVFADDGLFFLQPHRHLLDCQLSGTVRSDAGKAISAVEYQ